MNKNEDYKSDPYYLRFDDIIGESEIMRNAIERSKKVMNSSSPIILTGDSGTGKEMFARAIHFSSNRKEYPFIPVNCSAIPDNLIESILFGYEDGTFTGAKKGGTTGLFELANNGTIFLDEIGDMNLGLQSKMLRVLQNKIIQKVGSSKNICVNFRLLTATHKELHKLVLSNKFREDLFYRINIFPIRVPSLSERNGDIPILARCFFEKCKNVNGALDDISIDAINLLINYQWNGNVRELEHVIEYACNNCEGNTIEIKDLPITLTSNHRSSIDNSAILDNNINSHNITPICELEKNEINKALKFYDNSQYGLQSAASSLGISLSTLYRKIKKYNLLP